MKRRNIVKKRKRKVRSDGYEEMKRKLIEDKSNKMDTIRREITEEKFLKSSNIYANFAKNYANTLDTLVKTSANYSHLKAQKRRNIHKNEKVDNIERNGHLIIAEMRGTPAWQLHLAKLKKELKLQEIKWDHRDEEAKELERLREEIKAME